MRVLPIVLLALVSAACERTSGVLILDATIDREPDHRVSALIELEGADQGGGSAGQYCVSFHVFNIGFDPNTPEQDHYFGELDSAEECRLTGTATPPDLDDGDRRFYRLFSSRTDLGPGLPIRVQVAQNRVFRTKEGLFTP